MLFSYMYIYAVCSFRVTVLVVAYFVVVYKEKIVYPIPKIRRVAYFRTANYLGDKKYAIDCTNFFSTLYCHSTDVNRN